MNKNHLCVIPARSGSKGIPFKNIQKICGKPLIEYSINAAKESKLINRIIVSTDSKQIADIAKKLGAETPFMRPKKISGDFATQYDVAEHAVKFLLDHESYLPDTITILQPTTPIRTSKIIDKSITLLNKTKSTSVLSVSDVKDHPNIIFHEKNKYLKPFDRNFEKHSTRQSRTQLYAPTGSIYTFGYKTLKKYNSIYGPKIKALKIKEQEFNIDIDTIYDLFISEMTVLHWNKFKEKFNLKNNF
ncbi:Post-translational flagellin modification protein B [Marine Group I thaumarchaeote SCGC AAA799-P11]|uniref:Post-translational flagellin modification protein B n=1 Tax=Marine Group I thaumarchaeote SCGC AAA799-P11 TaxID=1502295 RepID=A0A087S310_9ARCH|nr:Post-translational flagellin modification protein B [Marine Group I thaumarchaeote SCGC AAA799-P11]